MKHANKWKQLVHLIQNFLHMYISLIFCNERIKITYKLSIPWNLSYLISASVTPCLTNTGKSALKCTEIKCKGIRIWSWYNLKWLIQKAVSLVLFYSNFQSMNECQVFPFFRSSVHQFALPNTKYALLLSSNRMYRFCIWIVTFEGSPSSNLLTTFHRVFQSVRYHVDLNCPS